MLKTLKIICFILLLSRVNYSVSVIGQNSPLDWKDYFHIKNSEAWLTSENAVGLKELCINKVSMAEISFHKGNGDFVNYHQSNNHYTVGANIESFYRLNPKIVLFGKIRYDHFKGKNMSGSAFMNPEEAPFDIVEYDNSTQGNKKRENYNLIGAVSAEVYKGIVLGGKIDFKAANYAKDKDLRHKNTLSDMKVTVGLSYKINRFFDLGANYYYRRRNEGLTFNTYGTTEKLYMSLISYGAFYGRNEAFEGTEGYTAKNKTTPLFDEYHGGAIQLKIDFNSKLDFFNELSYKKRDGYYGKESTSTPIYSQHNSTVWGYTGKLNYHQKKNLHSLDIHLDHEKLENSENIYVIEKPQGEATNIITYYDPLKVGDKEIFNATVEYTASLGIEELNPTWVLKGGLHYFSRKQTASIYPFYREQTLHQTAFNLSVARNFIKKNNMYSFLVEAVYSTGGDTPKKEGYYATPSENQSTPSNSDYNLLKEYKYLTCNQAQGIIEFKYSRLFPKIKLKGYASVNYSLTKAFNTKYLDDDSLNQLNITLGCTF